MSIILCFIMRIIICTMCVLLCVISWSHSRLPLRNSVVIIISIYYEYYVYYFVLYYAYYYVHYFVLYYTYYHMYSACIYIYYYVHYFVLYYAYYCMYFVCVLCVLLCVLEYHVDEGKRALVIPIRFL